jgi:hypothetical protein
MTADQLIQTLYIILANHVWHNSTKLLTVRGWKQLQASASWDMYARHNKDNGWLLSLVKLTWCCNGNTHFSCMCYSVTKTLTNVCDTMLTGCCKCALTAHAWLHTQAHMNARTPVQQGEHRLFLPQSVHANGWFYLPPRNPGYAHQPCRPRTRHVPCLAEPVCRKRGAYEIRIHQERTSVSCK